MWVASLEHRLLTSKDNIVITDCRFPNEFKTLKNIGATILRVKRGPEPAWYEHAKNYNKGTQADGWEHSRNELTQNNVHASEYSWVGSEFDYVLDNNSTVDSLFRQIDAALKIRNQIALVPA
jgi:hypothetical protein